MTLVLYTWATPNGHKPQILLEELGVPYELKPVNIFTGEQFTEEFRCINPNRRVEWGLNLQREHLTGAPNTEAAHEVMFGKTQFNNP